MTVASRCSRLHSWLLGVLLAVLILPVCAVSEEAAEVLSAEQRRSAQEALSGFNDLIGGWRGVGQPRRGSNRGAWRQNAEWVWDFQPDSVGVKYDVSDGKLAETGRVTWDPKAEEFILTMKTPDEQRRIYRGRQEGNRTVLTTVADDAGDTHRITITKLNDKRTLVLHEKQAQGQSRFFRVAEVGYTREGTRLAIPGAGQPECIVTGGAGTTKVSYQGKTYYVCCSGCKQAFEDDPEGIIAEAAERKKQEAAKRR